MLRWEKKSPREGVWVGKQQLGTHLGDFWGFFSALGRDFKVLKEPRTNRMRGNAALNGDFKQTHEGRRVMRRLR